LISVSHTRQSKTGDAGEEQDDHEEGGHADGVGGAGTEGHRKSSGLEVEEGEKLVKEGKETRGEAIFPLSLGACITDSICIDTFFMIILFFSCVTSLA